MFDGAVFLVLELGKVRESSRRASQLQTVPYEAEVAWHGFKASELQIMKRLPSLWGHKSATIFLALDNVRKTTVGQGASVYLNRSSRPKDRIGQFLYPKCLQNPEFADATLQGAQIKQKSLTATSSALWTEGALTLKFSMILKRCAATQEAVEAATKTYF